MYKLEITDYLAKVTIETTDVDYLETLLNVVNKTRKSYEDFSDWDDEVPTATPIVKQPAKKRGRPVGSRNKK